MLHPLERIVLSYFGATNDIRETGYVLSDGTMVDLSGRHEAGGYVRRGDRFVPKRGPDYLAHQRATDHRQLPDGMKRGTEGMREFMAKTGAIRVIPDAGITVASMPTVEAVAALVQGWRRFYTELLVDIMDPEARTADSVEFKEADLEAVIAFLMPHFEGRAAEAASPLDRKTPRDWEWAYHVTSEAHMDPIAREGLKPHLHRSVPDAPVIFVEPEPEGVEPYHAPGTVILRFKTPGFGTTDDGENVIFGGSADPSRPPDPPFVGGPGEDGVIPPERIQIFRGRRFGWLVG